MSNEAKNETVDPKEHAQAAIVFALRDIARTLSRAAGVQELVASNKHLRHEITPCAHCGCQVMLHSDGSQCPACGQARSGEPRKIATPIREPLPNGMGYPITVARGQAVGFAAGSPIGTVVVQAQAVDSLGADLTPAAIRTGWGCRCGELYEITGEVITGEPPPEIPPDWSVATQVTVDPGGTVTVEVAGLTADEDGWRCACGRRPVLRFVADDPAKLSDLRQTVTGRPFGAKHASPSYAAEPEPSPWRDVKEELPEESTPVLVWVRSFAPPKGRTGIVKASCDLAVRAGAKWVSDSGYEVTVTHWMPLPKEPTTW